MMDNNDEKKDLSADELIRMLNISLGLTPDGQQKDTEKNEENNSESDLNNEDDTGVIIADDLISESEESTHTPTEMTDPEDKETFGKSSDIDTLTDIDDSLIGFSDTLDRLDDTVYQPAPMSKPAQSRGVSSINITEEEPRDERKIIFDDADFEELDSDNEPTSLFEIEEQIASTNAFSVETDEAKANEGAAADDEDSKDLTTVAASSPDADKSVDHSDSLTEDNEPTRQSDLEGLDNAATRESDLQSDENPSISEQQSNDNNLSENDARAFDQAYNDQEDSSDGYDDAQHDIMFAVNFEQKLNDIFNDDISARETPEEKRERKKKRKVQAEQRARGRIDEYTSQSQKPIFLEKYKKAFTSLNIRIIASFIVSLLLIVLESLVSFGASLPHFISPDANPRVLILLCMQLFFICCGLAMNRLADGAKAFVTGRSTTDVLTFVFAFTTAAYGIYTAIVLPNELTLMFSPCAFCICISLISELWDLKREINSFKTVSSTKRKYAIEKYTPDSDSVDKNEFFDYLPENPELLKINKTSFVEKFATNFSKQTKQRSAFGIISLLSLFVAIAYFILMFVLKDSVDSSVSYAFTLLCALLPSSLYVAFASPLYKASSLASYENSTFIGETVADEYSSASVVSFDDVEVFPPYATKLVHHRIYPHARFDHVVYVIASLFTKLNGPLNDVFSSITNEIGTTDNVKIHTVYEDGIEADVDDEHVLIGSASFMENRNYIPAYTTEDEISESNNSRRIMYVAFGGTIVAKFYFQYTADGEFTSTLRQLTNAGMCIAVKTFDPNIDTALLANEINIKKYPVKVIKCANASELSSTSESAEATVISTRSAKSLLKTLTNCRKLSSVIKTGTLISVMSMLVSFMIVIFALIAGLSGSITSLLIVIYQLIWVIITKIVTGLHIK